jgi:hypothetical protein
MASIPFNQDFRPGSIKTSDPDQSRLQTQINHDFKPIQLWLQSLSIKISDPDQSRLQTNINNNFNPDQSRLQSILITISFPIN